METAEYGKSGLGLALGLVTAMIALVAYMAGRQNSRTNTGGRYEGWYDSLGI